MKRKYKDKLARKKERAQALAQNAAATLSGANSFTFITSQEIPEDFTAAVEAAIQVVREKTTGMSKPDALAFICRDFLKRHSA